MTHNVILSICYAPSHSQEKKLTSSDTMVCVCVCVCVWVCVWVCVVCVCVVSVCVCV
jgi:hypothetical protein